MIQLLASALALALLTLEAPVLPSALAVIFAVLVAPGIGWARRLSDDLLTRILDGTWIAVCTCVVGVIAARLVGDPMAILAVATIAGLVGWQVGRRAGPAERHMPGLVGALVVIAVVGLWGAQNRQALGRSLDAWWHHPETESLRAEPVPWEVVDGVSPKVELGWPEQLAARVDDPEGDGGQLRFSEAGRVLILLRGPVGAGLSAGIEDQPRGIERIETDPVVVEDEGPVPRYLDRGMVGVVVDTLPGAVVDVEVHDADGPVQLYVAPGVDAVWSVHADGELQFAHYYQILNIVENQRWADEMLIDRAITVHQPPLWAHMLAVPFHLVGRDLPAGNVLFLSVLVLIGLSAVRLLTVLAPRAPPLAWALPAAAAVIVGKLMLVPGSTNFPDPMYAAALVGGTAALKEALGRPDRVTILRFAAFGVLAGMLRYPGTIVLTLSALLAVPLLRARPWKALATLWGGIAIVGLGLLGLAVVMGKVDEWLFAVWFETYPEHWQNNQEAPPIWQRPPEFYLTWLRYVGYGAIALIPLAGRGTRWIVATALTYSLFLCTIDHFSSHYFLPLVVWSTVAIGSNAAALRWPVARWGLPLVGLIAAGLFIARLHV